MKHSKNPLMRIVTLMLAVALVAVACGSTDDDVTTNDPNNPSPDGNDDSPAGADSGADPIGTDPAGTDPFGNVEWRLIQATVDGADLVLLDTHPVTLRRDGDDVAGAAACNGYFGSITTGPFLFDGFGVTEMACDPPAAMELESAFLAALGRTTAAQNDDGVLTLTGDSIRLSFEDVPATPDADLEGTAWILDTIIAGEAASSVLSGTNPSLLFDGTSMSGSDGCNSFSTEYSVADGSLNIGAIITTLRGCEDGIDRQSQAIHAILVGSQTLQIDGDRLTINGEGGSGLVYRVG